MKSFNSFFLNLIMIKNKKLQYLRKKKYIDTIGCIHNFIKYNKIRPINLI